MKHYTKGDVIEAKDEIYVVLLVIEVNDYIKHLICFNGKDVALIVIKEYINPWVEYDEKGYIVTTGNNNYCDSTIIDITRGIDLDDINYKIKNFKK